MRIKQEKKGDIKDLFLNIEKDVEKKVKKNRKKIIRWAVIASFFIILFLVVAFFFGFNINVILRDELQIGIEPLQKSLYLPHNSSETVSFAVKTDKFRQCSSYCEYRLIDLKNNRSVFEDNNYLDSSQEITKRFLFSGNISGSGQIIYIFEVACNNIKSILCNTEEQKVYKTAFITLDYDLTPEEKLIKSSIKDDLLDYQRRVSDADILLKQSASVISTLSKNCGDKAETNLANKEDDDLSIGFASIRDQLAEVNSLWEKERYNELAAVFPADMIDGLEGFNDRLALHYNKLISLITLYNAGIQKLNHLINQTDKVEAIYDYYRKTGSDDKADKLTLYTLRLNNTKSMLEGSSYSSFQQLDSEINNLTNLYSLIEDEYSADLGYSYLYGRFHLFRINRIMSELSKRINPNPFTESKNESIATIIKEPSIALIEENCRLISALKESIISINSSAENILNQEYSYLAGDVSFNKTIGSYKSNLIAEVDNSIISEVSESANGSLYRFLAQKELKAIPEITSTFENMTINGFYSLIRLDMPYELEDYEIRYCSSINGSFNLSSRIGSLGISAIEYDLNNISSGIALGLPDNNPKCCIFDKCSDCCLAEDCLKEPKNYPVIFVHGHAFRKASSPEQSLDRFTEIQLKLQDVGFINAGQIDLMSGESEIPYADWGKMDAPITLRGSFYYMRFYDLGKYAITTEKSEGIENYAIRLKEIIDLVKFRTGKEKVNIISHSMGGLIVRDYISLFGEDDLDNVIMIATPNKGIKESINKYCVITGSQKECHEMAENSIFMKRLNDPGKTPKHTAFYNIIGTGCDMGGLDGDGIVTKENAALDYAENIYIKGACTDLFNSELHNRIVGYPETYDEIVEILETH